MSPRRGDRPFVFSSEHGELCPDCERPLASCDCAARGPRGGESGGGNRGPDTVRVARETKGRKGKGVTVVRGIPLAGKDLDRLVKELKRACGSGGTLKGDVVEIQGDHRDKLVELLSARGWSVKRSGG